MAMTERDWEAASRARLEKLVADIVERIRDAADEIEREARRNVASSASEARDLEFQTYPRAASQVTHSIQTMLFNLKLDSLADAAADAERARSEKRLSPLIEAALAVADENRDGDTPDSAAVRNLVRAADTHKAAQR
jgi:hypothetical protein